MSDFDYSWQLAKNGPLIEPTYRPKPGKCVVCQADFTKTTPNRKTCSEKCRLVNRQAKQTKWLAGHAEQEKARKR